MGDQLFLDRDMTAVESFSIAGGTAVVFTTSDRNRSGPNEDAAALFPVGEGSGVLVVADGVGGHPGGSSASTLAIQALQEAVAECEGTGDELRGALVTGFGTANERIREMGRGAATTLAVAHVEKGRLRTIHVGDSSIVLVGQRGKRKHVTVDHSPVGYAVESGLLDEREALHHEERHFISNAVGMERMRIDVGPSLAIAKRDTLVLATDGLLDNLFLEEVLTEVRTGDLVRAGDHLVKKCHKRMSGENGKPSKSDDLTFILFRLS